MVTIVSAFFSNVNKRNERNNDDYVNYGISLLKSNIQKIIFTDSEMYERIKDLENENTRIFLTKKEDIYMYEYIHTLENFNLNTTNASKDTIEFMFIMCNKTEVVRKAIELNCFQTDQFVWIDFGIKHIFGPDFSDKVEQLKSRQYDKVRIASIWNPNQLFCFDVYRDIAWYFAGGVFGGHKDYLLSFADKTKEMTLDIMLNKKTIMWEVNVWYLIYLKHPELFDWYSSDHNHTILDHY